MGVKADDGIDIVLEQHGADHIAVAAVRYGQARVDVTNFQILGVFHDVKALFFRPLTGDQAGITDAVPIINTGPAPGL